MGGYGPTIHRTEAHWIYLFTTYCFDGQPSHHLIHVHMLRHYSQLISIPESYFSNILSIRGYNNDVIKHPHICKLVEKYLNIVT